MDYLRRVWGSNADFEDISITMSEKHFDGLVEAFTDKGKNDLGHVCNLVRYLRDEMDINVTQEEDE